MIESKRGDTRGIEWCQCPVCEHEQWLTRCNYCHADIPHSLIKLQAENERLREALRQIITHQSLLTELADKTGASIIAREALNRREHE